MMSSRPPPLIWRSVSRFFLSPPYPIQRRGSLIIFPSLSSFSSSSKFYRLFSSQNHPSSRILSPFETNPTCSTMEDDPINLEDVTTEELKRRMEKYFEGDVEALPSIFEAILARKLTGKHEETDDELMEELRSTTPSNIQDEDYASDEELNQVDDDISDSDSE